MSEHHGPARLMRRAGDGWDLVTDQIPPVTDDDLHPPSRARRRYWHLPGAVDAQQGDILVVGERPYRLEGRCGAGHVAVERLASHMRRSYADQDWVECWLVDRQVWSCTLVDSGWLR